MKVLLFINKKLRTKQGGKIFIFYKCIFNIKSILKLKKYYLENISVLWISKAVLSSSDMKTMTQ